MRNFTLFLLFMMAAAPIRAAQSLHTTMPSPAVSIPCGVNETTPHTATFPTERISHRKGGFLGRMVRKMIWKRMEKTWGGSSGGKFESIIGLLIGILACLPLLLGLEVAVFLALPIAIAAALGLTFSIFGLIHARRWEHNRRVKRLAIVGIILNSLAFLPLLILLLLAAGI